MSRLPASLLRLWRGSLSPLRLVRFCSRQRTLALFFAVASGGMAFLTVMMKLIFAHLWRQLWLRLEAESDVGFPGGHVMYSLALRQAPKLVLWHTTRFAPWRRPALGVGSAFSQLDLETYFWAVWLYVPAWVLGVCALKRPDRQGSQSGSPYGSGRKRGSLDLLGTAQ